MQNGAYITRLKIEDQKLHFEYVAVKTGKFPDGGCPRCARFTCPERCGGWKVGMPDLLDLYVGMGVDGVKALWNEGKEAKFRMFKEVNYGKKKGEEEDEGV